MSFKRAEKAKNGGGLCDNGERETVSRLGKANPAIVMIPQICVMLIVTKVCIYLYAVICILCITCEYLIVF